MEADTGYTARIREERQLANKKLEKERASHKEILSDWHACWIKSMAENMKAVDAEHKRDTAKLEKKLTNTETTLENERIVNRSR